VFDSVVVGAFQITFRVEIYVNDVFFFKKIIFDISTLRRSKKYKPHSTLAKKNLKMQLQTQYQTVSMYKEYGGGDSMYRVPWLGF